MKMRLLAVGALLISLWLPTHVLADDILTTQELGYIAGTYTKDDGSETVHIAVLTDGLVSVSASSPARESRPTYIVGVLSVSTEWEVTYTDKKNPACTLAFVFYEGALVI